MDLVTWIYVWVGDMDGVWGAEVGVCWSVVTNLCAGVERMGERLFHGSDGLGRRGEEDGLASEGGTRPGRLMWPSYFILQLCFAHRREATFARRSGSWKGACGAW